MTIDITSLTIKSISESLRKGDFSARELAEGYLKRIEEKNPGINAYLEVFDDVLKQADEAERRMVSKENITPLTGIPIALKDNMLFAGRRASAASKMLENYRATYDATAVLKLKEAGAVFLGRTNMDEFAMGSSTERSAFGVTRNPHDLGRVPGGSSGGSAAAVAAGLASAALGSDTGGSIRQPAALCGVVGLKPTYGAVSRNGLIAMGSSLDQIGPLTKTVGDAEILFNVMRGEDPLDSTTLPEAIYGEQKGKRNNQKRTIGVPWHFMQEGVDPDVLDNFKSALKRLEEVGFLIQEVELPNIVYSLPVYYIIMPAEVSTNLARYDGIRYGLHKSGDTLWDDIAASRGAGFGTEVRRRILLGTYVLSAGYYDAYYTRANMVRSLIAEDFKRVFREVDMIATPTAPAPAFKIGEKTADPLQMYLEDIFTVPANIAGIPAISLPSGFVTREKSSLPVGVQLMAGHCREDVLFNTGKKFLGE